MRARPEPAMLRRLNLEIVLALVALIALLQPVWRPSPTLAGPDGLLTDAPSRAALARGPIHGRRHLRTTGCHASDSGS